MGIPNYMICIAENRRLFVLYAGLRIRDLKKFGSRSGFNLNIKIQNSSHILYLFCSICSPTIERTNLRVFFLGRIWIRISLTVGLRVGSWHLYPDPQPWLYVRINHYLSLVYMENAERKPKQRMKEEGNWDTKLLRSVINLIAQTIFVLGRHCFSPNSGEILTPCSKYTIEIWKGFLDMPCNKEKFAM